MAIEIMNMRRREPRMPYDVRVDRTSPLGNKFYMKSEQYRDQVCDQYQKWFDGSWNDVKIYKELKRLYQIHKEHGQLRLFCWCAPKRCHAETIKAFLDQYI